MANNKKVKTIVSTMQKFITQGGQITQLKTVVDEFNALLEHEEKQNTALITTAYDLSKTQQAQIQEVIDGIYQKDLDYEFVVESDVIAGIKVKVYDQVIDLTIDCALKNINQSLKH